jgi:hypothetical protein
MMRETFDFAHSEVAFFNQMPTGRFGTYVIPAEQGVVVMVCDHCRLVAVHDPDGYADTCLKVNLPDGMLDAVQQKFVSLTDEGSSYEVEVLPAPRAAHCADGFGLVFGSKDGKELNACFGSWFNQDSGNVIRSDSYRLEVADMRGITRMLEHVFETEQEAVADVDLNPHALIAICKAAKQLDTVLTFSFHGSSGAIQISSQSNPSLFALVMPMKREGQVEATSHPARDALHVLTQEAKSSEASGSPATIQQCVRN